MTSFLDSCRGAWRRCSRLDVAALVVLLTGATASAVDFHSGSLSFVKFLAILAAFYLVFRVVGWGRSRLLWSLRNRLIVAYLFIAVVPILLIMTFVLLAGRFLYSQLGAFLLYEDLHRRMEMITDISHHIAAAHDFLPHGVSEQDSERVLAAQSHVVHDRELPGLTIEFSNDVSVLRNLASRRVFFAGLLQDEGGLAMVALRELDPPTGKRVVRLRLPVTPEFLATIAPDLGEIQLNLTRPYSGGT